VWSAGALACAFLLFTQWPPSQDQEAAPRTYRNGRSIIEALEIVLRPKNCVAIGTASPPHPSALFAKGWDSSETIIDAALDFQNGPQLHST
jgi:hypothetical protein